MPSLIAACESLGSFCIAWLKLSTARSVNCCPIWAAPLLLRRTASASETAAMAWALAAALSKPKNAALKTLIPNQRILSCRISSHPIHILSPKAPDRARPTQPDCAGNHSVYATRQTVCLAAFDVAHKVVPSILQLCWIPPEKPEMTENRKTRRIGVVTSSRADYSHLYWLLRDLAADPSVDLGIFALGAHLSPEFGLTLKEIEQDGFPILGRIECLLSSDTDTGMAKTMGIAMLGLAEALSAWRPDLLLLIADRYEMLAPASVAFALRIPIAHIEGGEVSQGAIDDHVRNALTKLGAIHFTSTPLARRRVIAMGEEPNRVHHAGAPSLDHLRRSALLD